MKIGNWEVSADINVSLDTGERKIHNTQYVRDALLQELEEVEVRLLSLVKEAVRKLKMEVYSQGRGYER